MTDYTSQRLIACHTRAISRVHHAADLQSEIVVESCCFVLLNNKDKFLVCWIVFHLTLTSHPGLFWHEGLMASWSDLAIDPRRGLLGSVNSGRPLQGNAKDGLVLREIGSEQGPVPDSE